MKKVTDPVISASGQIYSLAGLRRLLGKLNGAAAVSFVKEEKRCG